MRHLFVVPLTDVLQLRLQPCSRRAPKPLVESQEELAVVDTGLGIFFGVTVVGVLICGIFVTGSRPKALN